MEFVCLFVWWPHVYMESLVSVILQWININIQIQLNVTREVKLHFMCWTYLMFVFPLRWGDENWTGIRHQTTWCIFCYVSQGVNWVQDVDHLFIDEYILLLEYIYIYIWRVINFYSLVALFNNSMVWSSLPYSSPFLKILKSYGEIGLFVLMFLVYSRCPIPLETPVWPTYNIVQVMYFSLYILLGFILFCGTLSQSCLHIELVVRKSMFKLVYWNKLLTLCISGLC